MLAISNDSTYVDLYSKKPSNFFARLTRVLKDILDLSKAGMLPRKTLNAPNMFSCWVFSFFQLTVDADPDAQVGQGPGS